MVKRTEKGLVLIEDGDPDVLYVDSENPEDWKQPGEVVDSGVCRVSCSNHLALLEQRQGLETDLMRLRVAAERVVDTWGIEGAIITLQTVLGKLRTGAKRGGD